MGLLSKWKIAPTPGSWLPKSRPKWNRCAVSNRRAKRYRRQRLDAGGGPGQPGYGVGFAEALAAGLMVIGEHNLCANRFTYHATCIRIAPGLVLSSWLGNALLFAAVPPELPDSSATFFLGRITYSKNDGNDCGGVGQDLMRLVSRASTLSLNRETDR